jgi:hypothetical protein
MEEGAIDWARVGVNCHVADADVTNYALMRHAENLEGDF